MKLIPKEIEQSILKTIETPASVKEIKQATGLDSLKLADAVNSLIYEGYCIRRIYKSDGVKYLLWHNIVYDDYYFKTIELNSNTYRFIALGDTHFGLSISNMESISKIYDYALKNNINNIIHLGDIIDGASLTNDESSINRLKYPTTREQVDTVIEEYPNDDSITNYILYGNHDFRSIQGEAFDISKNIGHRRLDFVSLGYSFGNLKINNQYIVAHHPCNFQIDQYDTDIDKKYEGKTSKPFLILRGHLHQSEIYKRDDKQLVVHVPQSFKDEKGNMPGAWDIEINFGDYGSIDNEIVLKPLAIDSQVIESTIIRERIMK